MDINTFFLFLIFFFLLGCFVLFVRACYVGGQMFLGLITIIIFPFYFLWSKLLRPIHFYLNRSPLGQFHEHLFQRDQEPISSTQSTVIDGDTLVIRGERIRIAYIDAPEIGQIHLGTGADAGRIATEHLRHFLKGIEAHLEVIPLDIDRYGRTVAMLRVGPYDVGLTMVKMGMAIATRDAPEAYKNAETWAREKGIGLWRQGGFIPPNFHRIFAQD